MATKQIPQEIQDKIEEEAEIKYSIHFAPGITKDLLYEFRVFHSACQSGFKKGGSFGFSLSLDLLEEKDREIQRLSQMISVYQEREEYNPDGGHDPCYG